jgi:phospholipase/carboxylesterase
MTLDSIEIETASHPTACIIILHGLGADGEDFVPVARELDLQAVGPVRFVFPHAPVRPVTINGGHAMRAWYDIRHADLAQREDEVGLRQSQLAIADLMAREIARGIPSSRMVLAGFSQGCAMALMAGLRFNERLGGVLGLSGYLPVAEKTLAERHEANAQLPVFMAHGTADQVIPIERAMASRDTLIQAGHPVEWHQYSMSHSVCAAEISDMRHWLCQVLN